jgi:branched-chain amino acid transport system substrate-binding protein
MISSYFKKRAFIFVIVVSVVVMMWGIGPWITGAAAKKPVKIGVLCPLSPPGDPIGGKRILWGAELGAKYVNEVLGGVLGGRPVELVVEDDSGVPAEGIAGYRKLVQKDQVAAVLGQYHSSVCLAVTKVSKDLGTALFSSAASSPKITETQYPTIFSNMSLTPDRSKFWVEWATKVGLKRIVVLGEDTDYGTGFCDWVTKFGKEAGLEVKKVVFPRAATDLTPALLETKAWKPDLTINVGVGTACYLMVKQAYDIGLFPQVPMLASYAWPVRPEYWEAV